MHPAYDKGSSISDLSVPSLRRSGVGVRAQFSGGLFLVQRDSEQLDGDRWLWRSAVVAGAVSVLCLDRLYVCCIRGIETTGKVTTTWQTEHIHINHTWQSVLYWAL